MEITSRMEYMLEHYGYDYMINRFVELAQMHGYKDVRCPKCDRLNERAHHTTDHMYCEYCMEVFYTGEL